MKKAALIVLIALFLGLLTSPVFAAGGKNQGSKGKGEVIRHQVQVKK